MAADKFDFGEFLAVLEAKRAALDALIGSYRAALAVGALGGDVDLSARPATSNGMGVSGKASGPIDLPQGALLGKSLPTAIQLYLSAARRKQTTNEVVAALKEGGVETTSQSFVNTVYTALHRLKAAGTVLKFNDGWALAEFYPENLRSRLAERDAKPSRKAPKRAAKKVRARTETVDGLTGTTMSERILEVLVAHGQVGASIQDIVDALKSYGVNVPRKYVRGVLSREYALGNLDSKRERGRYFAKAEQNSGFALVRAEERAS
jgi:Fe2+ or Zn2+ uptake regulation protein